MGRSSARGVAHSGSGVQTPSAAGSDGSPLPVTPPGGCQLPFVIFLTLFFFCALLFLGRFKRKSGIFLVPMSLLKVENTKIE